MRLRAVMAIGTAIVLWTFAALGQPVETTGKAALDVVHKVAADGAMDLIVRFNDRPTMKAAGLAERNTGLASDHPDMIEYRAAGFRAQKRQAIAAFDHQELSTLTDYSHLPMAFVRVHSRDAFAKLLAHPDVLEVYENRYEKLAVADSLPLIGQPQAQTAGYAGTGTTVVVLDTGVDYTKAAFGSCTAPGVPAGCKVVFAQDFTTNQDGTAYDDNALDNNGHGTNVAGIALGVAPGARIAALDVFGADIRSKSADIISAYNWSIANKNVYNIVAINMSLGSGKYTSLQETNNVYRTPVDNARAAGILSVIAAGNDGYSDALELPGATPNAISVGAVYDANLNQDLTYRTSGCTDKSPRLDQVTCFSNSASFLTVLAPGAQITAATITQSGTSQATPHVAGAVAVLRAAFPGDTLAQTITRIVNGTNITDVRNGITKARLNLPKALGLGATPPCTYGIAPTTTSVGAASSTGSITVTAGPGCAWSAGSPVSWVQITAGTNGAGNGILSYSIQENTNSASRTTNLTIAGHTFIVNQAGAVNSSTPTNLLRNPGFEKGHTAEWTEVSSGGYYILYPYEEPTATNYWQAWFCSYNDCVERLYQDVAVPADAQSAYLQFWYAISTDETLPYAYDYLTVRIHSPFDATAYTTVFTKNNLDQTGGRWVLSPQIDMSAWKGQTIRLEFVGTTDFSFPSSFFVDDVVLKASGSTPHWDVFWRSSNGADATWRFSGPGFTQVNTAFLPGVAPGWQAQFIADVNGDYVRDVVWWEPGTGFVAVWLMSNSSTISKSQFVGNVGAAHAGGWNMVAVGDVNGDGRADIVWRNAFSGQIVVWYLSPTGAYAGFKDHGVVPIDYQVRGVGDVNGDGTGDIVFFNEPAGGVVAIWLMHADGTYTPTFPAAVGRGSWLPYRVVDLDGDGKADLFWWNQANGLTAAWYMNGSTIADFDFFVSVPPTTWQIGTMGDFRRDGRGDLLWYQPSTGSVVRWGMNGRHVTPTFDFLPAVGGGWSMAP